MKKQFSIFVLTIFMVAVYAFSVYAADNLRFNTGDVFKLRRFKVVCWDTSSVKVKVKSLKLFMRVEKLGEVGTSGEPGYIPATIQGTFFTSNNKDGKKILGLGIFAPGYPDNYIAFESDLDGAGRSGAEIEVVNFKPCGDSDTVCNDSTAGILELELELSAGFDKKNPALKCYMNTTNRVRFNNNLPRQISGRGTAYCYQEGQIPTELDETAGSTGALMCQIPKFKLKYKYTQ